MQIIFTIVMICVVSIVFCFTLVVYRAHKIVCHINKEEQKFLHNMTRGYAIWNRGLLTPQTNIYKI